MDNQNPNVETPPVSYSSAELHLDSIAAEVKAEVTRATEMWGPQANAYEGFGVLLEEVDEFKAHAWMNQKKRDLADMRKETIQIAAMAARFLHDIEHWSINEAIAQARHLARFNGKPINSAHEGYIHLLREVEQMKRSLFLGGTNTTASAVAVAAVAMRITKDVCDNGRGRV
jgi:hypothetical protein